MSTEIKDRIAAIDGFGRDLAAKINERVVAEGLVGQTPATIARVEELIEEVKEAEFEAAGGESSTSEPAPDDFSFRIMRGGLTVAPLVTIERYLGKVGP